MMISVQQMLYCFAIGGIYLVVITLIMELITKKLDLLKGFPAELVEKVSGVWLLMLVMMEFLFFVVIPTIGYSFFYLIVPFAGVRAGLAATLFAFTLGAVPIVMGLSVRIKLPMPHLLFLLLAYFIKLGGAMAIIGYLYTL